MKSARQFFLSSFFLCTCVGLSTAIGASVANAATAYISDELTVPLRSGPSGSHRIIHRGLPSGTQMEVLATDESAGFSQIRTTRGTEGWIRTQYLVSEPIAKMRLAAAQRALAKAQADLSKEQAKVKSLSETTQEQGNLNSSSQAQIAALQEELAEIKRISAGAIEADKNNQKLTEMNARLKDELDDLAESHARLQDNTDNQMLMIGGALIFLGLIAGVLIKARPHRSAWS
jgi:SH3 domain protein